MQPLRHVYRPLAFYVSMELLAGLTWVMLAAVGFRRRKVLGTTVYYRPGDVRCVLRHVVSVVTAVVDAQAPLRHSTVA